MQKKKLVFFMPFIGGGGVEKNLYIISDFLVKKINDVSVCTLSINQKNKFNKKIKFITSKKAIDQKINIRFKYLICLFVLFKFLLQNRDSLVFAFQANIYCVILCKLLNVTIIIRSNSSPSGWYHNFLKKFLYKQIVSKANMVIVNSLNFKKQMEQKFNIKAKCIYNPLNKKDIILKSKKGIRDKFFNNNKSIKILNIGRLTKQKDQMTILKALKILKRELIFKSIIIGSGVEQKNLKEYIKINNLSKQIKVKKFMENPFAILKQADIFVLSSEYEGLPNVILEALVLKKIVISTNCPTGPAEILSNGKGGLLFKIGDYNQLKKLIVYVNKNKKKILKKVKYSYQKLDRFDLNKNLNEYYKVVRCFLS